MPATAQTIADIDGVFSDWDRPDFPGIAVGIVRDGDPIYTRCFGLANVEHGVPITPSTVFDIGSVTKQFTAFAILMLVRDGKLSLNDDIRDHIPELPPYDPPVRVRHCLYHTSGLTDWMETLELAGPTCDSSPLKRAYRTIIALRETMFPAGQAHSYSNTGFVLLAWIVARLTGKPLPGFLQERVFDPLGMSQSAFRSNPFNFFPKQAQGYFTDYDQLFRISGASDVCGDGGMQTNIGDMIRWLRNFTAREVGDAALFDQFFAPGHLDDGQELRYGAGWVLNRYRGFHTVEHGGVAEGFQSYIFWVPEVSIGVVVLGNVRPCLPWRLITGAVDVLLGKAEVKPRIAMSSMTSRASQSPMPDDIAGRYFTATGLPVIVDWRGQQLSIDIWLWARPFDSLSPASSIFSEEHSGDVVTFHRDAGGTVTHFTMETDDGACLHNHSPISKAVKYDFATLDQSKLIQFEGRYVSDEIDSAYTLIANDDGLTARHLRCFDWYLRPIKSNDSNAFGDNFAQESTWPGMVTFERSSDGAVTGFRVRGVRVNLFFRKLSPEASNAIRFE